MDGHQPLPNDANNPSPRYASFSQRFSGMLIDGLLIALASFVLTPVLFLPYAGLAILQPGALIALMLFAWRHGASPGMRAARIRLVDAQTGSLPRLRHLIPRAVIVLVFFGAVMIGVPLLLGLGLYGLMIASLGSPNEEHRIVLGDFATVEYVGLAVLLLVGIFANLWMLWDSRRQTLVDKLCGVVFIREPEPRTATPVPPVPPVIGEQQPGPAPL